MIIDSVCWIYPHKDRSLQGYISTRIFPCKDISPSNFFSLIFIRSHSLMFQADFAVQCCSLMSFLCTKRTWFQVSLIQIAQSLQTRSRFFRPTALSTRSLLDNSEDQDKALMPFGLHLKNGLKNRHSQTSKFSLQQLTLRLRNLSNIGASVPVEVAKFGEGGENFITNVII